MIELDNVAPTTIAWVLTFAIHSTILLLGAWLLDRRYRERPEIMSPVWKIAALGGLLTATVQLAAGVEPLGGRMLVGADEPIAIVASPSERPIMVVAPAPVIEALDYDEVELAIAMAHDPTPVLAETTVPPPVWHATPAVAAPVVVADDAPVQPLAIAAGLVLLGALVGLAGIARAWWCLHVQLRGRRAADGPIARLLARLLARTRRPRSVQLSISSTIAVPLATGIVRPEIVVPERALGSLAPAAQETMLAHELAHVLRRDPAWRLALLVLERVFFFQPLLRLARRRIAQHAEYLSDAWAVDNTAQPLELARCLTEIAGWVQQRTPVLAAGMAEPRSILGRRVLRLVAPQRVPTRMHALPWLAIAGLFATVMVAPAIGSAHERAHVMQHAAGMGAPMIVVVHEDGRAAGELETSPPGLPARAAVVVASDDAKGDRKAERKAAKERRATEKQLRKTIRAAKKQHRLPTAEELARVLGEGGARRSGPVAGIRVERDGEAMVIVLDPETLGELAELDDIDIDIDDEEIEVAIAEAHRARRHAHADHARAIVAAERAAKARARMHGDRGELERRIERQVERARAQADEQRRAAEHIREHADEIRERAVEEYMRAWGDAAGPRGRGGDLPRRRRSHPRPDIVPILAPLPPPAPSAPTAALAPLPPTPPMAPMLPPAPPAFAPLPPAPALAPAPPPHAPMLAPAAPRKRARMRHAPPPGITLVVAPT